MKTAIVMDIQRFSIHDGPGIRTTVFFKGCHMACRWCHNPESWREEPEMMFYENRCIGCGACLAICRKGAHTVAGKHTVDLRKCLDCEKKEACARICPAQALKLCGERMTAQQIFSEVEKDRSCYGNEGGLTCSGGEPLLQADFLTGLLPICRKEGFSVCVDTTLNVEWKAVEEVVPWTDRFLVDIKFLNEENHIRYTGRSGTKTVENLLRLSDRGVPVILRMPLVDGLNNTVEEVERRKKLLNRLHNVERIDCFAVSGHAAGKYRALQKPMESFNKGVDPDELAAEMKNCLEEKRD